jgi:tetratricopeptide (TPR) repeat protein
MVTAVEKSIQIILTSVLLVTACYFHTSGQNLKEISRKADKAIKQEHFTEAIPLLKTLVAHDSSSSEILFNLALALYNTGDYHGCVKASTRGIEIDSAYAAHHFRRGVCYANLENYQDAIHDYTRAIELDKKSFSYFNRALARMKSGDVNGGIIDFTTAVEMDPKDEHGFYYRALCYEEIGDTTKAIADLDHSIALKPKDPDIYDERAYLRFLHKNFAGAKADYLKCIELDPAYVPAHLSLAEISLISGEWLAAYQHAFKAVQHSSNTDDRVIGLLFKCAANKLIGKSTSEDEAVLKKALEYHEEASWEFDDLQQSLKQQRVAEDKILYISQLIATYYED